MLGLANDVIAIGDFSQAFEYLRSAKALIYQHNFEDHKATLVGTIATIFTLKGDIANSLEYVCLLILF